MAVILCEIAEGFVDEMDVIAERFFAAIFQYKRGSGRFTFNVIDSYARVWRVECHSNDWSIRDYGMDK